MGISPELYDFIVKIVEEKVKDIKVTKEAFDKLSQQTEQLAEIQNRTELNIHNLTGKVEELADAQKRTEQSLSGLTLKVEDLAEAQKNTIAAVGQLTHTVGVLSDTIGYGLEDIAKVVLPSVLEKYKAIKLTDFQRKFITMGKEEYEFDIYGEGSRDHSKILVIGECKSRIFRREVENFLNKISHIESVINVPIIKVMFGYYIHPTAQSFADSNNIFLVVSYMR